MKKPTEKTPQFQSFVCKELERTDTLRAGKGAQY